MLLAISVGNTSTKFGIFENDKLVTTWHMSTRIHQTSDEYATILLGLMLHQGLKRSAIKDVAMKGKEKWGQWASAWDEVLYWSYATPGIPNDRTAFLQMALQRTYHDPVFRGEMARLNIDVSDHFIDGKELKQLTSTIANLSEADIKEMEFVITEKYVKQ